MDITAVGLSYNFLPNLPKLAKTILLSPIGQSQNSEHQDTLTEMIVVAARPVLRTPAPIKRSQDAINADYGVFGRIWISKYTVPEHPNARTQSLGLDVRDAVELGITSLQPLHNPQWSGSCPCQIPEQRGVETEWTGYRNNVSHVATLPKISERELYHEMMKEVSPNGPTILYFHGGAHCLMDPATHRWTTSALAQHSGGRVFSVRYRLSPQNIFPAALIDALVAYLALLAPPPNAFHSPVPPSQIIIAGDSSGAGIAASLLLLLLTLQKRAVKVSFHDKEVAIPSPPCAGLALSSPWLDVSRCLPSCHENMRWDTIAAPPFSPFVDDDGEVMPLPERASPDFPADEVWPASPPRAETYCVAHMVSHPLVSPLAAEARYWEGAPSLYVCVGWEGMQDEAEVFARTVHRGINNSNGNARVVFDGYEGMPHCFAMVPWNWAGRRALRNWASFCRVVVELASGLENGRENAVHEEAVIRARLKDPSWRHIATWTSSKTRKVEELKIEDLGMTGVGSGYTREVQLTDGEVKKRLQRAMKWRVRLEDRMKSDHEAEREGECS
jgi:acetyl esterase/lipase